MGNLRCGLVICNLLVVFDGLLLLSSAKRCNKHATAIAQFESAKLCKALQYTAIKSHADEACQLLRVEGIHWQLTGRTISEIKLSALIVCQRWYLSTVLLLDGVDGVARVCIQL